LKREKAGPIRIAMLDIESTSLDASYGRLVCVCFKFTDEVDVRTVRVRFYREEAEALKVIKKFYDEADIICTWNGKIFDIPYLNARLLHHGLAPLDPSKMHKDLMYEAKKLRFRGARLDNISKDLRTETAKYDVPAWRWVLAAEGNVNSINEIVTHCEHDVILTQEMFEYLKPMIIRFTR
jgi:uncharacterized protein YprB with RNaseH-like and TPR domain